MPAHGTSAKAQNNRMPLPPVLFASFALADLQGGPSASVRAELLQRNCGLIKVVVENSIALAATDNALNRADACGELAKRLADEISRNNENETERAIELAEYLQIVLKVGVAANLHAARPEIPWGSNDEQRLYEVQERTAQKMHALEELLPSHGDTFDDLQMARRAVHDGLAAVEKAVKRIKGQN